MSGIIDPASHLNLDYPDHRVTTCIIAESFEVGAKVKIDSDGLLFATVQRSCYSHYGHIDYTQRLVEMIDAVKQKQQTTKEITTIKKDSLGVRQK
jgi:methyl coenzyme M reductase gamma subunit